MDARIVWHNSSGLCDEATAQDPHIWQIDNFVSDAHWQMPRLEHFRPAWEQMNHGALLGALSSPGNWGGKEFSCMASYGFAGPIGAPTQAAVSLDNRVAFRVQLARLSASGSCSSSQTTSFFPFSSCSPSVSPLNAPSPFSPFPPFLRPSFPLLALQGSLFLFVET